MTSVTFRGYYNALEALLEHRQREGVALRHYIEERLSQMQAYVTQTRSKMPSILQTQADKLCTRLDELKTELDEGCLEQEIVLLMNKADVAEELDRLDAHINEASHILNQSGAIGRRLDFMMQELN